MSLPVYDICVIGAGPAGLGAACTTARANLTTVIVHLGQIKKSVATGETLSPQIMTSLQRLGLCTDFEGLRMQRVTGFESTWGSAAPQSRASIISPAGIGWLFDRAGFEAMMLSCLRRSGATVIDGVAISISKVNRHWEITVHTPAGHSTIKAYQLIIATGRTVKSFFALPKKRMADKLVCYVLHVPCNNPDNIVRLDALKTGWLYAAKLSQHSRSLCYFTDGDLYRERNDAAITRDLSRFLPNAPCVGKVMNPFIPTEVKSVAILSVSSWFRPHSWGDGWVACGDTTMAFDPLSSQGISTAFSDGISAGISSIDYLMGNKDAFIAGEEEKAIFYNNYLRQRRAYYSLEQRWGDSLFWSRRNA